VPGTRGKLPPDHLSRGEGQEGSHRPLHSSTIVTKQNVCSVTCKCVCIPVSRIHNISKHGYRRAKQFGEEGGREESARMFKTKYFQKKFFTKIFPFSHRIIVNVKKVIIFRFTEMFSNFSGYVLDSR